jgi:hypothetical protein
VEVGAIREAAAQTACAVGDLDGSLAKPENDIIEDNTVDQPFRTRYSPDAIASRREIQSIISPNIINIKASSSQRRTVKNDYQHSNPKLDKSTSVQFDCGEEPHLNKQEVQTTSKPHEVIEILHIPESPMENLRGVSRHKETRPVTIKSSPRPKSASVQCSRALNSSTPLSTRSSGRKKKKRDYPSMKHFAEDGTDGINPRVSSPDNTDDDGRLMAMLEGPPPEALGTATPISVPRRTPSPATIPGLLKRKSTSKAGRGRELIEIDSDSGSGEISIPNERDTKRQKVINKALSEPRLRREILSPDLALKNKGRGRYSTSMPKR